MNTANALQLTLVFHLTGLVLMAGMSVADMLAYNSFWKQYAIDKQKGMVLLNASAAYQKYRGMGAALLLLTGVCMMALTHGAFGEQLWMRIKISIVVLLLINGPVIGRVQGTKLKNLISADNQPGDAQEIITLKNRVNLAAVFNLIFLAAIVILSVFKFN